jgi:ankyrin repeat protein
MSSYTEKLMKLAKHEGKSKYDIDYTLQRADFLFIELKKHSKEDRAMIVNGCDNDGYTALYWAFANGNMGLAERLIVNNAEFQCKSLSATSFLAACVSFESAAEVLILVFHYLKQNGYTTKSDIEAYINACDEGGRSALYWACHHNDVKAAELLIKHGAERQPIMDSVIARGGPALQKLLQEKPTPMFTESDSAPSLFSPSSSPRHVNEEEMEIEAGHRLSR